MTRDEHPWLKVAQDIITGKYDAVMDGALRESLTIGLQSINEETCQKALKRITKKK